MDPDQIKAAIEAIKNQDSAAALQILEALLVSAAGATPSTPPPDPNADPSAQSADAPPVVAAALTKLRKLTSRASLGEVVAEVETWKAARDADAAVATELEQTSRVELTAELVKLGYELPATAWEGDPKDRKPAKHLASMAIADLRSRVVSLRSVPRTAQHTPPLGGGGGGEAPVGAKIVTLTDGRKVTLSAAEIENCETAGAKIEAYALNKATREAARRK